MSQENKEFWPYTRDLSPTTLASNIGHPVQVSWDQEWENLDKNDPSIFICNVCLKTFYNRNALLNHKKTTHDIFNSEETLDSNTQAKLEQDLKTGYGFKFIPLNPEDDFGDEIITRTFTEDTSYLIVRTDNDDSVMLDKAGKSRFVNFKSTPRISEKAPIDIRGPFTCTLPSTMCPDLQCQQVFFNCCEYSLHYREEHTKRRKAALRCQVCEKKLDQDSNPASIVKVAVHAANKQPIIFPCRICGINFSDQTKFEEHNRLIHVKMKPHQCTICFKGFAQLGGLQQHLRMHTGIRPFICTFCSKAFTQKAGLVQHLRIHTKVKPFKCVVCSKCFSQSVHLRQHMRTHTNIQPFECSVCNKRFKQRSHLNFHLKSHMHGAGVDEHYNEAMRQQNALDLYNYASLQHVQNGENFYYAAELASEGHNFKVSNTYTNYSQSEPVEEEDAKNMGINLSNTFVNETKSLPIISENLLPDSYAVSQQRSLPVLEENDLPNVQVSQPQSVPVIEDDVNLLNIHVNQPRSLPVIEDDDNVSNLPSIHVGPTRSLPVIECDDNINNLPNMNFTPPRSLPVIEDDDNLQNMYVSHSRSLPVID